ncbi:MAG: HAMP domain-containing sensor histidine kinase, partial [Elusimicrobiaceae bacterium]|nr:HAMP domain-containing sensor histidine kinase [Elusimicrobiaceae bacterium]
MPEENKVINVRALSLISHKLKTPLSIINGYSEAILSQAGKEKFSPFTSKALEEINKQGKRMSQLVDKLFAFNKVSSTDGTALERKPVALKPLIKECAAQAIALNEDAAPEPVPQEDSSVRRGTFVEIDCPEGLSITANEDMLRLGVQELLTNSIKFNNKMEKVIKVQCANHGG